MKKIIPFLIGFLFGLMQFAAAETAKNDTTLRYENKTIHLEDSVGQIKVTVFDNDSTPYKKVYEGVFSDRKSYEKWTVMEEVGIQLPFLNKRSACKKKDYKMEAHWAGIGWGFANISDANYKLNDIDGVSLKSESSSEFYFNLFEKIIPVYKNNLGFTTGLGFDWHNYFLDNNTHLLEENNLTDVYAAPAGVVYEYSRLRTFQLTVPLTLEWQPTFGRNHETFVAAGVVGGVNTFASYKVSYKDPNGRNIKYVESKGLNVAPLTLDFIGQIGYDEWSIYAKYSPFGLFQSGKGPEVRAVSLGATFNF
ncbi:MAG TPA: hypothetical protein VK152_06310 [Paludibacter sp.]|nr:hypothetical protein [Paludibacter sp.]